MQDNMRHRTHAQSQYILSMPLHDPRLDRKIQAIMGCHCDDRRVLRLSILPLPFLRLVLEMPLRARYSD